MTGVMIRSAESAGVGSVIFYLRLDLWCSVGLKETKGDLPTSLICVTLDQHCHMLSIWDRGVFAFYNDTHSLYSTCYEYYKKVPNYLLLHSISAECHEKHD
jgi:hypothetical protein